MEPALVTPPPGEPRLISWRWAIAALFTVLVIISSFMTYFVWHKYWPNSKHMNPTFEGMEKPIFYQGELLKNSAIGSKEGLKLPFSVFAKLVDPTLRYEEQTESIIVTTKDKVVRLKTDQLTAMVNEKPFTLQFTVEKQGEQLYLPVEPLKDYYQIDIRESDRYGAVFLLKAGDNIQWGKVISLPKHPDRVIPARSQPTVKAPIFEDVKQGEAVMIWAETDGWYRVQLQDGTLAYMKKSDVLLDHLEKIPQRTKKEDKPPWKPLGGKINLTWQQVGSKNPDTSKISAMPGLNVISPQWFHLIDAEGNIKNLADASFVKWAHAQNYQLWALFSNSFDSKFTTAALATYDKRMKMIKQLVSFAQMYNLEGINIDFENVLLKDKSNMVQFVRELTPFLHEQGLVVSIDVTVKDGSENYSLFMDRRAVGEVVDYMMVMTYDEHWATSPVAGSVASLPWVEKGIVQIMKEDGLPPSKLLLGIPFYTRIWTEQTKDGKTIVTSKAASMETVQKIIADKKLTPTFNSETGQNYVEYAEDGKTMKIWIEDDQSIKSRVELMKKLDLAGIASWSRTFETPGTWTLIKETMEKKP